MQFSIESIVSNFIENQFPRIYREQGPDFVMFTKAYYEWMENKDSFPDTDGSLVKPPIYQARKLLEYRDIDETYIEFLEHFQQKYLYGIPFSIIISKRYLLKHIFDVYRSKGTIQCFRLLFKLIYDEDVEIYLPGKDLLKPSDGSWHVPRYLELSNQSPANVIAQYVGKTIIGVTSKTVAVAEDYGRESLYRDRLNILYISNLTPKEGEFTVGEAIVELGQESNTAVVMNAPRVLGSLATLEILNGGDKFIQGDALKIMHREAYTNAIASFGDGGIVRVIETMRSRGSLYFDIQKPGFGFTSNAQIFLYNSPYDKQGHGASFTLNSLTLRKKIYYNTDIFCDHMNNVIGADSYDFPKLPTANAQTMIGKAWNYGNNVFGAIESITNIKTGYEYQAAANAFVRSTLLSNTLPGNVSYNNTWSLWNLSYSGEAKNYSNTDVVTIYDENDTSGTYTTNAYVGITTNSVGGDLKLNIKDIGSGFTNGQSIVISCNTVNGSEIQWSAGLLVPVLGDGTNFDLYFDNNDIVELTDNTSAFIPIKDIGMIKQVINATCMFLYGNVTSNSTANSCYKVAPVIIPAQFSAEEADKFWTTSVYDRAKTQTKFGPYGHYILRKVMAGTNDFILADPTSGNSVVKTVNLIDSGKGYLDGELVKAYLYAGISNNVNILAQGSGYQNTDVIIFSGGSPSTYASGRVVTDENGSVVDTIIVEHGSGYQSIPKLTVKSFKGKGCQLEAQLSEFNYKSVVTGRVKIKGSGTGRGYWTNSRSFLSDNKYIQDSYYYQDYSYEIQTGFTLDKYKNILYDTFHPSGNELFGKYVMHEVGVSESKILYESVAASFAIVLTCDDTLITSDTTQQTVNEI